MAKYIWGNGINTPDPITNAKLNQNVDYAEELANAAAILGGQFAQNPDTTAALVFGYKGGNFRSDNTITAIADGTVSLTDDDTNYIEVSAAGVTANTSGFTSGKTPLYVVTTAGGVIDSVADKRAWAFLSNSPGDMLKSIYDTDNDGVVDAAEAVPWSGVSGKPASFAPSAHAASHGAGGADEIAIDGAQVTTGTIDKARLPVMGGATSIAAGTAGMAPTPAAGDDAKVLFGDGTYKTPPGANGTVSSVNTRVGDVTLDSSDVGLDNVTNDAQLKAADLDTDSTFAANSDTKIPSQKAVKTALAGKVSSSTAQSANRVFAGPSSGAAAAPTFRALAATDLPIDTDGGLTANSDTVVPTQKAVKTYVDNNAGGGGTWGSITGTLSSQTDLQSALNAKAALASPTFTGSPKAPTASSGTNTTQLATTAFVFAERAAAVSLTNKNLTSGTNTFPTFNQNTTGNAATATKLQTARTINGVAFDGTANITISASGGVSDTITASEALAAGDLVNVHDSSGRKVRKANASDETKPAVGFVLSAVASSASATVYFAGQVVTGLTGLTAGATLFLATTGGGVTATAPTSAGQVVQVVGVALSATTMLFLPEPAFIL